MAVTKLISALGQDQALHNVNEMTKGADALMDRFGTPDFNNIDRISESVSESIEKLTSITTPNLDSLTVEPLAGSKCPAY